MAVFYIGEKKYFKALKGKKLKYFNNLEFFIGVIYNDEELKYLYFGESDLVYMNPLPVLNKSSKYVAEEPRFFVTDYEQKLKILQNEVIGINYTQNENDFELIANSVKMSRGRIYICVNDEGLYLSNDLRELLPFSNRKLSVEITYGILKYGESPELNTIIEDIYSVPSSSFIKINKSNLKKILSKRRFSFNDFEFYFKINYPMTGGVIGDTTNILSSISEYYANEKANVFISGGVDSTLINFMINEKATKSYDGYYYYFGQKDKEIDYAIKSIKGTKCNLNIVEVKKDSFFQILNKTAEELILPIYDNGSAFSGAVLNTFLSKGNNNNNLFVDSTAADGTYGSRDYNTVIKSYNKKNYFEKRVNELINAYLLKYKYFPRDSFVDDRFLQELQWYLGPFGNIWFKNSKKYTGNLYGKYNWYLNLNENENNDDWITYTIYKLFLYASKQTCSKTYDMLNNYDIGYPFMFLDVLNNQGLYSWKEKTKNGIIKYPLKKILEKYIDKDFIYRDKVGLNSPFFEWIKDRDISYELISIISKKGGVTEMMLGKRNLNKLKKSFYLGRYNDYFISMLLSFSGIQVWIDKNNIKL